jgi:hypothetical protein
MTGFKRGDGITWVAEDLQISNLAKSNEADGQIKVI